MKTDHIIFSRKMNFCTLYALESGKMILEFQLTEAQKRFYGKQVSPFFCFKTANLCELNLKRPHLTCFSCKLRRIVSKKLPLTVFIQVHQIWCIPEDSSFKKLLFKNLLSLAEFAS